MYVLLSIKPEHVEKILKGTKKYEFRRNIFKKKCLKGLIYATSPMKRIVASFSIKRIFEETPENLWIRFHEESGITQEKLFKYFEKKEKGYAIKIDDLDEFEEPIDPKEANPSFRPPQSFYYVEPSTLFNGGLKNRTLI